MVGDNSRQHKSFHVKDPLQDGGEPRKLNMTALPGPCAMQDKDLATN